MTTRGSEGHSGATSARWLILLALPLAGLALLIARPEWDLEWRHQPSHFWLVLGVAVVNVALAYLTNEAASRRRDARLLLISLAFGASAGFLALHALATPGVLLPGSNLGFVIATPFGLTLASVFAAASALPLGGPRGALVLRHARMLRAGMLVLMVAWGAASLLELPPLNAAVPIAEVAPPIRALAVVAVALYAFAAWHFFRLHRLRGRPLLLALVAALVLLAEAMLTVAVSRDWHLSWWEWHVLMALAFGAVALGARVEYGRERSLTGTFDSLYLAGTLERLSRWHADALSDLAAAQAGHKPIDRVLARLRVEGASTEELALLDRASLELQRVDELFRPYLPGQLATRMRTDPDLAQPGRGTERDVSVLFADLAGFTTYSERHPPTEVVDLLNAVWSASVPVIDHEDGLIESFTGDGLMVIFNALGDQPDHALRAARTAIGLRARVDRLGADRDTEVPRFHIGVNSGSAVVGSIGASGRRSFSAIGDTTNLGARLQSAAEAGEIVVGAATWSALGERARGEPLGSIRVKGKREPIQAWRLSGLA